MKKTRKNLVAVLLILAMILSLGNGLLLKTEASTETSQKVWNMGDFTDEELAEQFTFLKTSHSTEGNMYISDGALVATYEDLTKEDTSELNNIHKKALLKDLTGGYIDALSVEVSPADENKFIDAAIWMGVQPNADGQVQAHGTGTYPGIRIRYRDVGSANDRQALEVKLYTGKATYTILNEEEASGDNTIDLYSGNDADTIKMELKVNTDNTITWTLSSATDSAKTITRTIDLTTATDETATGFNGSMLKGQVGLGAFYRGASFADLAVTYTKLAVAGYDFSDVNVVKGDFTFYSYDYIASKTYITTGDTALECKDGSLTAKYVYNSAGDDDSLSYTKNNGYHQKIIYNQNVDVIDTVSVDMAPVSDGKEVWSGLYLYAGATKGQELSEIGESFTGMQGLSFAFNSTVNSAGKIGFFIRCQFRAHSADASTGVTYAYATNTQYPDWYTSADCPITMQVEVLDRTNKDSFLITVMDRNDPTNAPVELTVAISDMTHNTAPTTSTEAWKTYMSTEQDRSFGLGSWYYGAKFDNLALNGKVIALDGIKDSTITVGNYSKLPTGANVDKEGGKHVLGWTINGNAVDTYGGYQGIHTANVVDPDMLEVLYQNTEKDANDKYTVRFIASLNEFYNSTEEKYENYKKAGFVFTTDAELGGNAESFTIENVSEKQVKQTYNLYSGLMSGGETVTADVEYGGNGYAKYFFAYELTDMPEQASVYVRAYVILDDGTVVYGLPKAVTMGKMIDVYIIAGQSNAAGATHIATTDLNVMTKLEAKNATYISGYSNVLYSGTVQTNTVSLTNTKANIHGNGKMGPEIGMAESLSTYYNADSGNVAALVKYGYGGTSLLDKEYTNSEERGNWVSPSYEEEIIAEAGSVRYGELTGKLYDNLVAQVRTSLEECREAGYHPVIRGMYWMQGEADRTSKEAELAEYERAFIYFASDIRKDLVELTGEERLNNMPIIIGEISETYASATESSVKQNTAFIALQNSLAESVDNCYIAANSEYAINELVTNDSGESVSQKVEDCADTAHWNWLDCLSIGNDVGNIIKKNILDLSE